MGSVRMAKTKVSIYLLKEGATPELAVPKGLNGCSSYSLDGGSLVYVKQSFMHSPKWIRYFSPGLDLSDFKSSSVSALHVLAVEVGCNHLTRVFAVSFGYGYTLLDKEQIEERFGLRVALNQSAAGQLRKMKRTSISANSRKTDEQMPVPSPVDSFSADIERDLLDGVTISGGDGLLATGSITGSDSLSLSIEASVDSMPDFLRKAYEAYESNAYKEKFAWADRIASVKSPSLIEDLNNIAAQLIEAQNPSIYMAVPSVLQWEVVAGFRVNNQGDLFDDICIDEVMGVVGFEDFEFESLKKVRIEVIGQADDAVIEKWRASDCLYGEVTHEGESYCLNAGKWFHIDGDYRRLIDSRYANIPVYRDALIDYQIGENEGPYNSRLVEDSPTNRILLDRRTVHYGGQQSQIELCDVLCKDGSFIHVKHYSGSATLSHFFNQGLVSARLIKGDSKFREKAQSTIDSIQQGAFELTYDSIKEVVFAIISKFGQDKPQIPFFSKVALESVQLQLESMGIKVSIAMIREVDCC